MTRILFTLILSLSIFFAQAQSQNFEIGNFKYLEVGGPFKIYFTSGPEYAIKIDASDKTMEKIEVESDGDVLSISINNKGSWKNWGEPTIYLQAPTLHGIELGGACQFYTKNVLNSTHLALEVSGACEFKGELIVQKLVSETSGASRMYLVGKSESATFEVSGASSMNAEDFICKSVVVDLSGASNAKINGSEKIMAEASGASTLRYKGDAPSIIVESSGSSTVKKL
ncbi:head GIN domain-containing protein [Persicobacter diffluens]|uniref:Putative auto-transporter adhesin head GIN domain-containing protein n=1 Tax=Persicobacter diffluens TaxID=981 RepID=A0AAN4VXL6_9BACT|nr:hypothetical protein PEDI_24860 [Persicobacter diffluens]